MQINWAKLSRMKAKLLLFLMVAVELSKCEQSNQSNSSASTNLISRNQHLRLFYTETGRVQIPGLYDDLSGDITPIQGQAQFERLILGLNTSLEQDDDDEGDEKLRVAGRGEQISLVQFYMASCPDCQGFSPYFKRFARDIGVNWRKLIKIYTVNCNDFQNIHLCQEQNPKLIVPLVRWYTFPSIQRDHIKARTLTTNYSSKFDYPQELLNIAHRQFIPKQRRDLTSLRRATLRFIALTLDELSHEPRRVMLRHQAELLNLQNGSRAETNLSNRAAKRVFYESLPSVWRNLFWLGAEQPLDLEEDERFLQDLSARISECFGHRSFIGRTLIADWSSLTCSSRPTATPANGTAILFHRTTNLNLLKHSNLAKLVDTLNKPILLTFNLSSSHTTIKSMEQLNLKLVAWNETTSEHSMRRRKRRAAQRPRLERVQQRALLEEYYSRWANSREVQPIRYATAMGSIKAASNHQSQEQLTERSIQKRDVATNESHHMQQVDLDNVNWLPEFVYANEERTRYHFNKKLVEELNNWPIEQNEFQFDANQTSAASNWAEIAKIKWNNKSVVVIGFKEDDLTLMYLTDYYRALDEIVHIDLVAKGQLDGYQLLASCCFLRDLDRHFPFQGNALGSHEIGSKSIARHYIQLVQRAWLDELRLRLGNESLHYQLNNSLLNLVNSRDNCNKLTELFANGNNTTLERVSVSSRELEQIQLKLKRLHSIGLPGERHLKWKYCAGSEAFLRGHTCSLWILFHTLTVHEYLLEQRAEMHQTVTKFRDGQQHFVVGHYNNSAPTISEYKFQVDYSRPPKRHCEPRNPDGAYLASKPNELFVNHTQFVLANVINFVRFYLPCTNCAAHFSCMVEHSHGLHFELGQVEPDSHLLWLWEAHNRVNERTRSTHSEDPTRPKHIFPNFNACPQCYLEQPKPEANFTSMRFNRAELVKFVVARYRKSAILNNQINIEDLYRKP